MPFALSAFFSRIPRWVWVALAVAIIAFGVIRWHRGEINDAYNRGVTDTDGKWIEASNRLKETAAQSATRADDAAAARLGEYKAQVEDEMKAIEAAKTEGSSPLDALFGG